jgi:hypothetical protein
MIEEHSATEAKPAIEEENVNMQPTLSDDVEKASNEDKASTKPTDAQEYPPIRKVIVIMISLYLAMFLVSLVSYRACSKVQDSLQADFLPGPDNHCHGCAQCVPPRRIAVWPRLAVNSSAEITDEFHSLGDIGWYGR